MTANPNKDSWIEYYQRVHSSSSVILDYSNPQTQAQTFGIAIEAAGAIRGKRCLDVGCGRGQLSLALAALEASDVVGIDIIADSIEACRKRHPHVTWEHGSPDNDEFCKTLGQFDSIFVIEMLQYVDWRRTLHILWNSLNPGGRIVIVVPNKDNSIVQKTIARFSGNYVPFNPSEFATFVTELSELECWGFRYMDFAEDQRIVPYVTSPWTTSLMKDFTPNRLAIVIQKQGQSQPA